MVNIQNIDIETEIVGAIAFLLHQITRRVLWGILRIWNKLAANYWIEIWVTTKAKSDVKYSTCRATDLLHLQGWQARFNRLWP